MIVVGICSRHPAHNDYCASLLAAVESSLVNGGELRSRKHALTALLDASIRMLCVNLKLCHRWRSRELLGPLL